MHVPVCSSFSSRDIYCFWYMKQKIEVDECLYRYVCTGVLIIP